MSWDLIRAVRRISPHLHLVQPFGLNLRIGDVVSVSKKTGALTLHGTCSSLLAASALRTSRPTKPKDFVFRTGGVDVEIRSWTRKVQSGAKISFGSRDDFLLGVRGQSLTVAIDLYRFRQPILDAFKRGIWAADHALITSVISVDKLILLKTEAAGSSVSLSFGGGAPVGGWWEGMLMADVSVSEIKNAAFYITGEQTVAFCSALRVRAEWLGKGKTAGLEGVLDDLFWEDFAADQLPPDEQYTGMLTVRNRAIFTEALKLWAKNQPTEPSISFLGLPGNFTPLGVVSEVEQGTSNGVAVLEMLQHAARLEGIDAVFDRLTRTDEDEAPEQEKIQPVEWA